MIRQCGEVDFEVIWNIINDGAHAYRGVIPEDCWKEPYMSKIELGQAIADLVEFWGFELSGELVGVMGIQPVEDVTLIRHAYVRTSHQRLGIGSHLLAYLRSLASGRVLVGTWADAPWAIRFYEKHGFEVVPMREKKRLLQRYWAVPERQIETSVVLLDRNWRQLAAES